MQIYLFLELCVYEKQKIFLRHLFLNRNGRVILTETAVKSLFFNKKKNQNLGRFALVVLSL